MTLLGSVPGSNGDIAFWGDLAVVTNMAGWELEAADDGFSVVDIADPAKPTVLGSFTCVGAFQDVTVWDGLAILSQDRIHPNDSCGGDTTSDATSFAGLRIVSIADPAKPVLLASVPTGIDTVDARQVRGTHTHTIVPDLERDRLLVPVGVLREHLHLRADTRVSGSARVDPSQTERREDARVGGFAAGDDDGVRTIVKPCFSRAEVLACSAAVLTCARITTSSPRCWQRNAKREPINPLPPVINTRIHNPLY